ncbi:MAG: GNAT family N-acetyltransferase [Tissierellia bacterium]|nr:GNAT family N-acetyltransferase [Tissierellia bacterium]
MERLQDLAHEQLKDTVKKRIELVGGFMNEGDGFMVYDMGNPEDDAHLRGGTFDADGDVDGLIEAMKRFEDDPRKKWSVRVHPRAVEKIRTAMGDAGFFIKDETGGPMMIIDSPIKRELKNDIILIPQNADGEKLLEEAIPVLSEAFELEDETSKKLLLGGMWTTDPCLRAAIIKDGDQVVSFGMLTKHPDKNVAGIYYISTLEAHRGKGLGKDIVTFLTNLGFKLGADKMILQASVLGKFVYDRLGYESIGIYKSFKKEYK